MKNLFISMCLGLWITSCQNQTSTKVVTDQIASQDGISTMPYTQDDQENITRLIGMTLKDQFKEDLEKEWIDTISRKFKYEQFDLNGDGKKEIFVGLTGPYFCGSGGCTMFLLSNQGNVITRFTVIDYPLYISTEETNEWRDLILYSNKSYRKVSFESNSYPSNPSTLDVYSGNLDNSLKILDWEQLEFFKF